jgi:hypothetical protein
MTSQIVTHAPDLDPTAPTAPPGIMHPGASPGLAKTAPAAIDPEPGRKARDLAARALWSDHPLTRLTALAYGQWAGVGWVPSHVISIRQLIAIAESLPPDVLANLAEPQP